MELYKDIWPSQTQERKIEPLRRESDKMIILHCNCCIPNTKFSCDCNGVPGGRCLVGSLEVFGPGTENLYTLCKVVWFGLDFWLGWFFCFFVFIVGRCFKCLQLKETLSRESLRKYFESPQIQNLMIILNPANPSNLSP